MIPSMASFRTYVGPAYYDSRQPVTEITHCLRLNDGELPLDLLPELHKLTYSRNSNTDNKFALFINAYKKAGRFTMLVDL